LTARHKLSGVRAACMGSSIFALQWSHCSLQSEPVIEMAGHRLLPQLLVQVLNPGEWKRSSRVWLVCCMNRSTKPESR